MMKNDISKFNDETKNVFALDVKSGVYTYKSLQCKFQDNSWTFSIDSGKTWHSGKFPSGLNLIKINMDNMPITSKPKRKGKQ